MNLDDRRSRWALLGAFAGAGLLCTASVPFYDLPNFIVPGVDLLLHDPGRLYSYRHEQFGLGFPLSYPPLFFALLAPFVGLARGLGLTDFMGMAAMITCLPLLVIDLAAAVVLQRLTARLTGNPMLAWRVALAFLYTPLVWFSSVHMMHQEGALFLAMLGVLACLWAGRPLAAGGLLGVAFLLKTTAVVFAVPLVLVLAARRELRAAALLAGVSVCLAGAVMVPFYMADPEGVWYSFVTFERLRPIYGPTAAKLVVETAAAAWWTRDAGLVALGAVALVSAGLAWRWRRGGERSLLAAVLVAHLVAGALYKWHYPHYFVPLAGLLLLWGAAGSDRDRDFPWVAFLAVQLLFLLLSPFSPEVGLEATTAVRLRAVAYLTYFALVTGLVVRSEERAARGGEDGGA